MREASASETSITNNNNQYPGQRRSSYINSNWFKFCLFKYCIDDFHVKFGISMDEG